MPWAYGSTSNPSHDRAVSLRTIPRTMRLLAKVGSRHARDKTVLSLA